MNLNFWPKLLVCLFFATLQTFAVYLLLLNFHTISTKDYLSQISNRVKDDILYEGNGKWNLSRYNADPHLPDTYPLYLIAADGFVIDRWKPIRDLIDTTDTHRLLSYTSPQTIITDTNQTWRMYSQSIPSQTSTPAVVTVGYFNPSTQNILDIDNLLKSSAEKIISKIKLTDQGLDTSGLDIRDINYAVSFQVADQFSKVVIKNNNSNSIDQIPNFIDKSYFGQAIKWPQIQRITDPLTSESFILHTSTINDSNHNSVGVIVVGKSENQFVLVLQKTLPFIFILFLTSTLSLTSLNFRRTQIKSLAKTEIHHLSFDKTASELIINECRISIPYATYQYDLCKTIFSNPAKKWETDELMDRLGDRQKTSFRKIYDTMLAINKKVLLQSGFNSLIIHHDKIYQLNPILVDKVIH